MFATVLWKCVECGGTIARAFIEQSVEQLRQQALLAGNWELT